MKKFMKISETYEDDLSVFDKIKKKVMESGQFNDGDMKDDNIGNEMLTFWNVSVCPTNAMLGAYLAKSVLDYLGKKDQPVQNFIFCNMWSNEAVQVLMRDKTDEFLDSCN